MIFLDNLNLFSNEINLFVKVDSYFFIWTFLCHRRNNHFVQKLHSNILYNRKSNLYELLIYPCNGFYLAYDINHIFSIIFGFTSLILYKNQFDLKHSRKKFYWIKKKALYISRSKAVVQLSVIILNSVKIYNYYF